MNKSIPIHQCSNCDFRFNNISELIEHCRNKHPEVMYQPDKFKVSNALSLYELNNLIFEWGLSKEYVGSYFKTSVSKKMIIIEVKERV